MKAKLVVHTGSMFSGKTTGLQNDLKRYSIAKKNVLMCKPRKDNRYSDDMVVTHEGAGVKALPIDYCYQIAEYISEHPEVDVIGIDEIQFFQSLDVLKTVNRLLALNKIVVVAGLDMDFRGNPFGALPTLMCIAEEVYKHKAVCMKCGEDAWVSHRLSDSKELVVLGATNEYIPLCRNCYNDELKCEGKIYATSV